MPSSAYATPSSKMQTRTTGEHEDHSCSAGFHVAQHMNDIRARVVARHDRA
jgi:hypothetical protein